jgi:hypothetical protein
VVELLIVLGVLGSRQKLAPVLFTTSVAIGETQAVQSPY